MDAVDSIPQYQKQQIVRDVYFHESNYLQKSPLSDHHEQKKNNLGGDGRIKPIAKMDIYSIPQYQKENADTVDYYVPNYLQKPSLSDHHKLNENLGDDDLEERLDETRRARSILLSMPGFSVADLWDDDVDLSDEFTQSAKEEKAWRTSNTCTSCGYLNWKCWCKPINYEEMRAALKGPSTPVKTQQKELFPWLTIRCSPNAP